MNTFQFNPGGAVGLTDGATRRVGALSCLVGSITCLPDIFCIAVTIVGPLREKRNVRCWIQPQNKRLCYEFIKMTNAKKYYVILGREVFK